MAACGPHAAAESRSRTPVCASRPVFSIASSRVRQRQWVAMVTRKLRRVEEEIESINKARMALDRFRILLYVLFMDSRHIISGMSRPAFCCRRPSCTCDVGVSPSMSSLIARAIMVQSFSFQRRHQVDQGTRDLIIRLGLRFSSSWQH
jgi:hypothetical protein